MLTQTAKVIISAAISLLGVVLYLVYGGKLRRGCMIAMLLSTGGDIFMTDFFHLGEVSTFPGGAFFLAAHIVFALSFRSAGKEKGYPYRNAGSRAGAVLTAAVAVVLAVLAFAVSAEPQPVMFVLILVYLAVIGFNLVSQFSYGFSERGLRYLLILAMTLFLASDFAVFLPMLKAAPDYTGFIWATYIPAQLLTLVFCDSFKKQDKK